MKASTEMSPNSVANEGESISSMTESSPRRELRRTIRPQQRYSASPESTSRRKFGRQKCVTYTSGVKSRSKVWVFCEKIFNELGERKARCKLCGTVLCHNGGSTRGILHHLRSQHGEATKGAIRPAALKGPRDAPSGIDIEDDDAWVRELDDEDEIASCKAKEASTPEQEQEAVKDVKPVGVEEEADFETQLSGEEAPSYEDEVFIREDGSYVTDDLDEYVDVVYVQDEGAADMMVDGVHKHANNTAYTNSEVRASSGRRNVTVSPPHIAMPLGSTPFRYPRQRFWKRPRDAVDPVDSAHYEMAFDAPEMGRQSSTSRLSQEMPSREAKMRPLCLRAAPDDRQMDVDEHFAQVVILSLRSLPEEQRARARVAVLSCIAELTDGQSPQGSFREE